MNTKTIAVFALPVLLVFGMTVYLNNAQAIDGYDELSTSTNVNGTITKHVQTQCNDGLSIAHDTSQECNMIIEIDLAVNQTITVVESVPSHLDVTGVLATNGTTSFTETCAKDPKRGNQNKGSTPINCNADEDFSFAIDADTRKSPSGKNKFAPTSCGLFEVNGGISVYDEFGSLMMSLDPTYVHTTPEDVDCDTVLNEVDNCPDVANTDQLNVDGDSAGAACDADDTDNTIQ